MNCPICNFSELSEGAVNCPSCQSDLEVFGHIENVRKQHIFKKRLIAILVILLAIVLISWGTVGTLNPDQRDDKPQSNSLSLDADSTVIVALKTENGKLTTENMDLQKKIETLQEKLNASVSSPTTSHSDQASQSAITHLVKEGESLWKIAEKYYKDGWQYKKIAEDNGLSDPKNIRAGIELKINK